MSVVILSFYPLWRGHDANVALIKDGEILFAYEEEKLTRSQHHCSIAPYPERGWFAILKEFDLYPDDVDFITSIADPKTQMSFLKGFFGSSGFVGRSHEIRTYSHHLAHAALAVLTSEFDECLYFTIDGGGQDDLVASFGIYRDNMFYRLGSSNLGDVGIGIFYTAMTYLCGFGEFEEGKMMGLSGYGKVHPELYRELKKLIKIKDDGFSIQFEIPYNDLYKITIPSYSRYNYDYFRRYKVMRKFQQKVLLDIPSIQGIIEDGIEVQDIAATGQRILEEMVIQIIKNAIHKTGIRRLALSGGVFLNVILNKKIREMEEVKQVYIPMAVPDSGLALGAALLGYWETAKTKPCNIPLSPHLGPEFSTPEIEGLLKKCGLKYQRVESGYEQFVAGEVANGKIVGWFHGRGEYGPRALGARSVLADPRDVNSKARVNQLLKKRDWFMPYAPSILEEYMDEYLIGATPAPYMTMAFSVKPEKRDKIPAAVHVDGTVRPQTVSQELNPKYYNLIKEFYKLTGIPMILNTSFNEHGQPTIATPRQAIDHLLHHCIDMLAIDEFIVYREFDGRKDSIGELESEDESLSRMNQRYQSEILPRMLSCKGDD